MNELTWIFWPVISLLGLVVGSFLNVCIYRIPKKISVVKGNNGRSLCPNCGHTLAGKDLVPLFSFLFLRGRCRYCKAKISWRYPLIELANSLLWTAAFLSYGLTPLAAVYCCLFSVLLIITFIDWDTQEIPYVLTGIIVALGLLSLPMAGSATLTDRLIGLVSVAVPMIILTFLIGGFGGGDIQMMAATGFLLGWKVNVVAMFFATVLAGLFVLFFMRRREKKAKMAFGPFLAIGLILAIYFTEPILTWYMSMF